ncbi:MAG: DUF5009 domain-containing protein [Bacteroidales bacterium]|nr:DUF5009 domain-containing protein [Bacteroidales bacterium]
MNTNNHRPTSQIKERVQSLDILRGADLFFLGILGPLFMSFKNSTTLDISENIVKQFSHVNWTGFTCWDLIMPLFMFMAGTSMPYSLSKYKSNKEFYLKIVKRFILLFILGSIVQGNLLALDINSLKLFSNTLQAIAVGYLFSAIIYRYVKSINIQIVITAILLIVYWISMSIGGDYTQNGNFAEKVDNLVLGHFRDGAYLDENGWHFADYYHYTWIVSSINFIATVMTGLIAGEIIKSQREKLSKSLILLAGGAFMIVLAQLLNLTHPIIKTIWTSSMVLFSSGISYILLSLFYYIIDVKQWGKHLSWLKIFGMNSIAAYLIFEVFHHPLNSFFNNFIFGLKQFFPSYYPFILNMTTCIFIFLVLNYMFKKKIFLKV